MPLPSSPRKPKSDAHLSPLTLDGPLDRLPQLADFRFRLRQFLSFSEITCEAAGLTSQQYQLLQMLGAAERTGANLPVTISAVADRLLLRHNSAVELVDRAVRAELVRREADPGDHRRAIVQITERGRNLLEHLTARHLEYLQRAAPELIESLSLLHPAGAARPAAARTKAVS